MAYAEARKIITTLKNIKDPALQWVDSLAQDVSEWHNTRVLVPKQETGACGIHTIENCRALLMHGNVSRDTQRSPDCKVRTEIAEALEKALRDTHNGAGENALKEELIGNSPLQTPVLERTANTDIDTTPLNIDVIYVLIVPVDSYRPARVDTGGYFRYDAVHPLPPPPPRRAQGDN
jgi:hypothetical protein